MQELSQTIERKFVDQCDINDWEILTDTGWHDCVSVAKTVEYEKYELVLANGYSFSCADTHIVFDQDYNERFVKDLQTGDLVLTDDGIVAVVSMTNTGILENMYDVSVDSENHRYYTNGILSHNTTTAAAYLLWYATFTNDVTILIAAHKFKAASEIMLRVKYAYEELPDFLRAGVTKYNQQDIAFDNGSRIVATTTTPDSGRGMSISLLYLDEFAFVRPRVAEEFWASISPTLATGGRCIITSTPKSDEDMFAELWFGANKTIDEFGNETAGLVGINGFKAFTAHYSEVPGRDDAWAQTEKNKIGLQRFQREFECEFAGETETLISGMCLQRLVGQEPKFKTQQVRWYAEIEPNKTYLVALDPSAGVGKDFAAITVWCLPDMIQVAEWCHNLTPIPGQVQTMLRILEYIWDTSKEKGQKGEPDIYYTLENNSWGEAALVSINEIGEERFPGQFVHEPRRSHTPGRSRKGLNTNVRSKAMACSKFKTLIETNRIEIRSKMLIRQLKFFVSKGDSFSAKQGEHDDVVMSSLLAVRMMSILTTWDEKIGDLLRDELEIEESLDPMPMAMSYR